jgi:hypothetical protein
VKNEVLRGAEQEICILHKIQRRKTCRIGYILCRNCLLKHVIDGKIEVIIEGKTGRRGRRRKQLVDELRETIRYRKIKEEALDRTCLRTRCGRC